VRASAFYEAPKTIGINGWSPTLVDFYIGCGPTDQWVTITETAFTPPVFYLNDEPNNILSFPAFTTSLTYCPIIDYSI
jgi:hypothetical protein